MSERSTRAARIALSIVLATGCATRTPDVAVMIITDLRAVGVAPEFDRVRTTLTPGGAPGPTFTEERDAATLVVDGYRSDRVALFAGVPTGAYTVETTLLLGETELTNDRRAIAVVRDLGVTLRLERSCLSVACMPSSTCDGGDCVPIDACEGFEPCRDTPECLIDATCPTGSTCARARCIAGVCYQTPDDLGCAADETCNVVSGCQPCAVEPLFEDRDGDGIGGSAVTRCPAPGFVTTGGDCDDADDERARDCGVDGGALDVPESLDAEKKMRCGTVTCGDGCVTAPGEACDDANENVGDGCADCAVEPGYTCVGAPSTCERPDPCEPEPSGPADEDLDGVIDEHCPWYFTAPIALAIPSEYGGSFSGDGLTFYLDSGRLLQTTTRAAAGDAFPLPDVANPAYAGFFVATASADECEVYVQFVDAPGGIGVIRRAPAVPGASCRGVAFPAAPARLDLDVLVSTAAGFPMVSNVVHPYLSSDGLELFVVAVDARDELNRTIVRLTRREPIADFAVAVGTGVSGELPSVPGDGFTLFYRSSGGGVFSRIRDGRDDPFGPEQSATVLRVAYFAPTGEVLFAGGDVGGVLLGTHACRSLPCSAPP